MATTGNRLIASKKAFENDPIFKRLKASFPNANTNKKRSVTKKRGKK